MDGLGLLLEGYGYESTCEIVIPALIFGSYGEHKNWISIFK